MKRIKNLPTVNWDGSLYDTDKYGYAQVDIFVNEEQTIGERVFCIFREKDLVRYDDSNCYEISLAILCNHCGVKSGIDDLIGLNAGQIIPIQFNGEFNPIVPLEWIESKFWYL
jgi:hypothetical protein